MSQWLGYVKEVNESESVAVWTIPPTAVFVGGCNDFCPTVVWFW